MAQWRRYETHNQRSQVQSYLFIVGILLRIIYAFITRKNLGFLIRWGGSKPSRLCWPDIKPESIIPHGLIVIRFPHGLDSNSLWGSIGYHTAITHNKLLIWCRHNGTCLSSDSWKSIRLLVGGRDWNSRSE